MKTDYFVIEGVINGGFWNENTASFRGFIFATKYESDDCEEIRRAIRIAYKNPCKITKIFYEI